MTQINAIYTLRRAGTNNTIASVYDETIEGSDVSEALATLLPSFEYPDWDYRTIKVFLKVVAGI